MSAVLGLYAQTAEISVKFDGDVERIRELLRYGPSVRKIARVFGYTNYIALNTYTNKRGLHPTENVSHPA
jgi:hypothetical protein